MIDLRFVPLAAWPHAPCTKRQSSPFKATWKATLDLLERELKHLRATDTVLQTFYTRAQIDNRGWPKAGMKASGPGVILSFESKPSWDKPNDPNTPLSFPCDQYTELTANVRAIALSLEALRSVDRYGVTRQAEQYRGWAQIAAPAPAFRSKEEAAEFIKDQAGVGWNIYELANDHNTRQTAYRAAAKRLHPDSPETGNHELFVKLQQALAYLEKVG